MEFMIIQLLSDHQFWYQPITLNLLNDIRFFPIFFFSSAERVWAKYFQIESHKKLTKVPKNLSHILFFWFQQILIWKFFSPGFLYQVPSIIHLMNLIQLAENFYTAESISRAGSGLIFFPWWNSKYVRINL